MKPNPIGSTIGSMRYFTRHRSSCSRLRSSSANCSPASGMMTKRLSLPAYRSATSMLLLFTLSTISAPASSAVLISPASKESMLTRKPASASSRTTLAELGERAPRRTADVDDVGTARAVVLREGAQRRPLHLRRVVDLGQDLDLPGAVVGAPRGAAEILGNLAQVLRPLLNGKAESSRQDRGVALAQARGS